jgi:hypothetical protein
MPSAMNPAARSSMTGVVSIRWSPASTSAIGALREPGEATARRIPQRASSSTSAPICA